MLIGCHIGSFTCCLFGKNPCVSTQVCPAFALDLSLYVCIYIYISLSLSPTLSPSLLLLCHSFSLSLSISPFSLSLSLCCGMLLLILLLCLSACSHVSVVMSQIDKGHTHWAHDSISSAKWHCRASQHALWGRPSDKWVRTSSWEASGLSFCVAPWWVSRHNDIHDRTHWAAKSSTHSGNNQHQSLSIVRRALLNLRLRQRREWERGMFKNQWFGAVEHANWPCRKTCRPSRKVVKCLCKLQELAASIDVGCARKSWWRAKVFCCLKCRNNLNQ